MSGVFSKEADRIVPRAEFRVFGSGVIDLVQEHMWNGKTVLFQARRMPAETYFLSLNTNEANVKVRDGLLDIKRLAADPCDIDTFIGMVRKHPEMTSVTAEKMRYGFGIDGIICEYARVWFNGALVETACAESENYAGIKEVVEGLGIAGMPNTNYLRAAKRVVGMD